MIKDLEKINIFTLKELAEYQPNDDYPYEKVLPWDLININPGKKFLVHECQKLINL